MVQALLQMALPGFVSADNVVCSARDEGGDELTFVQFRHVFFNIPVEPARG